MSIRDLSPQRVLTVRPSGELDIATAPSFAAQLELARRTGLPVIVDLERVEFMDATGLKVLVDAVAAGGRLALTSPPPQVQRLFELTGSGALLPISTPETEAEADARAQAA